MAEKENERLSRYQVTLKLNGSITGVTLSENPRMAFELAIREWYINAQSPNPIKGLPENAVALNFSTLDYEVKEIGPGLITWGELNQDEVHFPWRKCLPKADSAYTINHFDYYDGPLSGYVAYKSKPHWYMSMGTRRVRLDKPTDSGRTHRQIDDYVIISLGDEQVESLMQGDWQSGEGLNIDLGGLGG